MQTSLSGYAPFNLIAADFRRGDCFWASNDQAIPRRIERGIFGLSNAGARHAVAQGRHAQGPPGRGAEDGRVGRRAVRPSCSPPSPTATLAPEDQLPSTGIGRERERLLSPAFIRTPDGTLRHALLHGHHHREDQAPARHARLRAHLHRRPRPGAAAPHACSRTGRRATPTARTCRWRHRSSPRPRSTARTCRAMADAAAGEEDARAELVEADEPLRSAGPGATAAARGVPGRPSSAVTPFPRRNGDRALSPANSMPTRAGGPGVLAAARSAHADLIPTPRAPSQTAGSTAAAGQAQTRQTAVSTKRAATAARNRAGIRQPSAPARSLKHPQQRGRSTGPSHSASAGPSVNGRPRAVMSGGLRQRRQRHPQPLVEEQEHRLASDRRQHARVARRALVSRSRRHRTMRHRRRRRDASAIANRRRVPRRSRNTSAPTSAAHRRQASRDHPRVGRGRTCAAPAINSTA